MPKVSVIIPNYNHAQYLSKRIDSVLGQTFQDYELIILDDASTDKSREVIEQYKQHPKVKHVLLNENNSGSTFKQWDKGVALANGQWIWFAESDDYCEPNFLSKLIQNAELYSNVVLSYCQSYCQEEGKKPKELSFYTDPVDTVHWKKSYFNQGISEINSFLLYRNTIPNASAVIFSREAYLKADKAFKNMRFCGDWMLWVQLLKIGNIAFVAEPLNHFRFHGGTTRVLNDLQRKRRKIEEEYIVISAIKKLYKGDDKIVSFRINEIFSTYLMCFTNFGAVKFFLSPSSLRNPIPYTDLLLNKLKNIISQLFFCSIIAVYSGFIN